MRYLILLLPILIFYACKKDTDDRVNCEKYNFGSIHIYHLNPGCLAPVNYIVDGKTIANGTCGDFSKELDSINTGTRILNIKQGNNVLFRDTVEVPMCNDVRVDW